MSRLSKIVEKCYTKTIKWKNDKYEKDKGTKEMKLVQPKGFYYYEKSEVEGETGKNVMIEAPFTFVWLTSAQSFTGFNKPQEKSVYSNEVLSEKETKELFPKNKGESIEEYTKRIRSYMTLTAKLDKETIAEGLYGEIKETVVGNGGKFCMPVYALLQTNEGTEIVRFLLSGASVQSWIPFFNSNKAKSYAISFDGTTIEKENGATTYECPVFKYVQATTELMKNADEAAQVVEDYFRYTLDNNKILEEEPVTTEEEEKEPWDN